MIPWQFGPNSLTPYFLAMETISFSRASPSGPTSLKPALLIIINLTPFFPQSSIA